MRFSGRDPVDRWIAVRPLALFTACFLAGLIIGRIAPALPAWGLGAVAAGVLMAVFRRRAFAFALAMMLGALWIGLFLIRPAVVEADDVLLVGRVDGEAVEKDNYVRLRLGGVEIDGRTQPYRVMLYLYDAQDIPPVGAEISLRARTWAPDGAGNPGGFDYADWLWRQRIALCASAGAQKLISVDAPDSLSPAAWPQAARARIAGVIRAAFSDDCEGLVIALVTGDKSEMPEESRENYRASGVSHLLAISGLHVGVLFLALEWLLMRLRLSRRAAFFTALPFMAGYVLLVGAPASVLRACLMYAAGRAARFDGRPRDGATVMCLSMLPLLMVNPLYIEDTGFVLSYAAVAGLTLFARRVPEREPRGRPLPVRLLRRVGQAARVSFAAQLGAVPATVCFFNQLPVWFLPFNVVMAPLMIVLFPALLAVTAVSAVCAPLGAALARPAEAVIRLFGGLTAWGARMPWAMINGADWPGWMIALYAAAAFVASPYTYVARRGVKHALALASMPAVIALALFLPALVSREGLEITFLDVGQGDGAVVRAEDRLYLIDVGDGDAMARYLLSQGLRPDGIFLSHGHSDHAGGLSAIVDSFQPCPLYISSVWDREGLDEGVEAAWRKAMDAGWPAVTLTAGDELALSDSVVLRVWHPGLVPAMGLNENSLVCSVTFGWSTALFTGDLPAAQELVPLPDCTVLKVGHHGSRSSTGPVLLEQVTPAVAVISVGHNSYGHPAQEVLDRLDGVAVYRTDERGAVTVSMNWNGETTVTAWLPAE